MIRPAVPEDIASMVDLLTDDDLGRRREGPSSHAGYRRAFDEIAADGGHELLVAEIDGRVVGVVQVSMIPNMSYRGGRRAQVESMHVAGPYRGRGIGTQLLEAAIELAGRSGCRLVQLTSDRRRPEAHGFYAARGFTDSHIGFKMDLGSLPEEPNRGL